MSLVVTPEGKVKKEVKKLLDARKPYLYYEMNVPGGYGKSGLDFIGAFHGHAFAIETKAECKDPSARQEGVRDDMLRAGMAVFVIVGENGPGMAELADWLQVIDNAS